MKKNNEEIIIPSNEVKVITTPPVKKVVEQTKIKAPPHPDDKEEKPPTYRKVERDESPFPWPLLGMIVSGIILLFLILFLVPWGKIFGEKTVVEKSSSSEVSALQMEMEELRARLALADERNKIEEMTPSTAPPSPQATTDSTSALVEAVPLKALPVTEVTKYDHGAVVRRIGPVFMKDGIKYQGLFMEKDPGSRMSMMYPVGRDLTEIKFNMSFDEGVSKDVKSGELVVFDTVLDRRTNQEFHVYAWRLH